MRPQHHSPFTVSETEPVMEAGELVARDWGAEEAGSSTMTSISLLLSSGGMEPVCSSLLMEIWRRKGRDHHHSWRPQPMALIPM